MIPERLWRLLRKFRCERCGSWRGVQWENSRTMYHYEGRWGSREDPNRDVALCRPCAEEHHECWDSMWADYNSGRL